MAGLAWVLDPRTAAINCHTLLKGKQLAGTASFQPSSSRGRDTTVPFNVDVDVDVAGTGAANTLLCGQVSSTWHGDRCPDLDIAHKYHKRIKKRSKA